MVTLKHSGRSVIVELPETNGGPEGAPSAATHAPVAELAQDAPAETLQDVAAEAAEQADVSAPVETRDAVASPPLVESAQASQAIQRAQDVFQRAGQPPRWPMYVRQVKQYLRAADEGFDERKFGFATIVEFLRACQREGVFRLERDRQGVLRVFPGANLQRPISQIGSVAESTEISETPGIPLGDPQDGAAGAQETAAAPTPRPEESSATPAVTDGVTVESEAEPAHEREAAPQADTSRARVLPARGAL